MKKIRFLALGLVMLLLTGCGGAQSSQQPEEKKEAAAETTEQAEAGKEAEKEAEKETAAEETSEEAGEDGLEMELVDEETPEDGEAMEEEAMGYEDAKKAALEALQAMGTIYADIKVKDYGTISVKLDPEQAPISVLNYVNLAEQGFYDGLTFHRIISGFMIQGGDPLGNGMGGSDQQIVGEFAMNGINNQISHVRGVISMARSMDPNSASSQFFIVHEDSTFLDGQYAGFGMVEEGMEIVDKICQDAKPVDDNGTIPGDAQPVIEKITIRTE